VFGRGDPNLRNFLWNGHTLRLVDFEYAGWSDRAHELADLIEHPESRATPDSSWQAFIDRFDLPKPRTPTTPCRAPPARPVLDQPHVAKPAPTPSQRFTAQVQRTATLLEP
jgi:phosphotransferase family enzyme